MKPTGKCLKEFEAWLLIWLKDNVAWLTETPTQEDIDHFYSFPDAMKYGVLEDYFDSVGIDINEIFDSCIYFSFLREDGEGTRSHHKLLSRTESIEKANEIRNGQLN